MLSSAVYCKLKTLASQPHICVGYRVLQSISSAASMIKPCTPTLFARPASCIKAIPLQHGLPEQQHFY